MIAAKAIFSHFVVLKVGLFVKTFEERKNFNDSCWNVVARHPVT